MACVPLCRGVNLANVTLAISKWYQTWFNILSTDSHVLDQDKVSHLKSSNFRQIKKAILKE